MRKFTDFGGKKPVKKINEASVEFQPVSGQNGEPVTANLPGVQVGGVELDKTDDEIAGTTESNDVSTFFSKLFESKEMANVYHLQVRGDEGSYAGHMALQGYYENVLELIDDVIETYQGQYGLIEGYDIIDTSETKSKEPIAYFEELGEYIKHAKKCISEEDTHLHSIIDDIVCLLYKTLYKLKFNK
jgi:hypothetical protein